MKNDCRNGYKYSYIGGNAYVSSQLCFHAMDTN